MTPAPKTQEPTDALGTTILTARRRSLFALTSIIGTICLWEIATALGLIDQVLLPSPAEVVKALIASILDGSLLRNIVASFVRVVEGFFLAMIVAVPMGISMGVSRTVFGLLNPLLELLRPIPPIAVIPLTILWFGIGELSKALLIAYGAFFPILVNTMAGFRQVERVHVHAAQALGASRYHIFRDVVLRSALPFVIVGARLGMGMAFIVLVAAELIASNSGLGYMINDARYNFRTDQMFVGMACIGTLGFGLNVLLLKIEGHLLKWKSS